MAKGYGFEVNDWLLVGAVAVGAYFIWKASQTPKDLLVGAGTAVMSGATNTVEMIKTTEKTIWNNDGINTTPKGFVDASTLPKVDYQVISKGYTPSGLPTNHALAITAAIKSGGYYSTGAINQKVSVGKTPSGLPTNHATAIANAISHQNYYASNALKAKIPEVKAYTYNNSIFNLAKNMLVGKK